LTECNRLYFEHLAQTNHGNSNGNSTKAVDLLKWTNRPSKPRKAVIAWIDKETAEQRAEQRAKTLADYYASIEPPTAETLAEYEQTRRQAEQTRRADTVKAIAEIRADERKHRKPTATAEPTAERNARAEQILKLKATPHPVTAESKTTADWNARKRAEAEAIQARAKANH
jgi:hypothetical protein